MAYITEKALVITDCASYKAKEVKALIAEFRTNYPNIEGFKKRTDKSLLREWAAHALCYRWNIKRERTKDADCQFDMEPEVKFMYDIVGPIALLILKFYK